MLTGSVAEFLPNFQTRVRETLKILLGEAGEKRVRMGLAKDGSGVGGESHQSQSMADIAAALTALQAKKAIDSRLGAASAGGNVRGQTGSG